LGRHVFLDLFDWLGEVLSWNEIEVLVNAFPREIVADLCFI
jgi:hypothetical protein